MWKFCILIAFATNCAICSQLESIKHYQSGNENTLDSDLREFLNIIPVDDIRNLTKYFYANDMAMRESYNYLRTAGYKLIVENLSQLTILKKFTNFLNDTGVNLTELKKRVENVVLTSEETESIVVNEDNVAGLGGINAFFREALLLIPQDEVFTLFFAKIEQSSSFSSLLERLSTTDYENLMENLQQSQGLQMMYFDLHAHGIDILEWAKSLKGFAGY